MVRPRRRRRISSEAAVTYFKPAGVPTRALSEITLSHDEWEALRLIDTEGIPNARAAEMMDVSSPTFSRVLARARCQVATAITRGHALRIEGGDYEVMPPPAAAAGRGRGRRGHGGGGFGRRHGHGGPPAGPGSMASVPEDCSTDKETPPMKIAVPTTGDHLDAPLETRFGRAPAFLLINPEDMSFTVLDNAGSQGMAHGAGITTAEKIANSGADVALAGRLGPKAASTLSAAGVEAREGFDGLSVREAVEKFKAEA